MKREDQIISIARIVFKGNERVLAIPSIPLKRILQVSEVFRQMDLSRENLWLLITDAAGGIQAALTDRNLYIRAQDGIGSAGLGRSEDIRSMLAELKADLNTRKQLQIFIDQVSIKENSGDPGAKLDASSFDDFISKMKHLGDIIEERAKEVTKQRSTRKKDGDAVKSKLPDTGMPQEPGSVSPVPADTKKMVIDEDYMEFLSQEGDKLWELIAPLNEDQSFLGALHKAISASDVMSEQFGAQHVVIQDIIRIYNMCDTEKTPVRETRARYSLAYLFERLQDKDMARLLSLGRINEMVEKDKFSESIEKLKTANYLKLPPNYDGQLLLPSLLSRLKHPLFEKCAAHYIRYANILMKADGEITAAEEEILKRINRLSMKPKINLIGVHQSEAPEGEKLEDVLKELNELIGMANIKSDIESLTNFLKVQKLREEQGLAATDRTLHAVFMGPPGTGKTTIARLLARIYKHLGYLANGHLVETDRAGLVAGYVGQTALKVDEVVKAAIDGVLFIDEAYSLARGDNGRDFGSEAVEALLKRMEDHRKNLVVIVAGYPTEMTRFVESNPGLQSRFNRYFKFEHYTGGELLAIFKLFAKKADFILHADAEEKLSFIFDGMFEKKDEHFGNARVARNLFEECVVHQANRIVSVKEITKDILMTLTEPDIPPVKETIQKYLEFGEVN